MELAGLFGSELGRAVERMARRVLHQAGEVALGVEELHHASDVRDVSDWLLDVTAVLGHGRHGLVEVGHRDRAAERVGAALAPGRGSLGEGALRGPRVGWGSRRDLPVARGPQASNCQPKAPP